MRLYKMELYKICHKKIFIIGALGVMAIVLLSFTLQMLDEEATVDGVRYTGYHAVQVNKKITEEFKGALTDEKIAKIAEKYGFPSKVEHGWNYFRDANFLNQFVMDNCSDGYMNDENNYRVASKIYPLAETNIGKVMDDSGKEVILEYYRGWEVFLEVLSMGMVMGSILILFGLAGVFAGEGQTKMLSLLFTAKEGKENDVHAKVLAAATVAVSVWFVIIFIDFLLCGIVYGFDGLRCYNSIVIYNFFWPTPMKMIPMWYYLTIAVILSFFGILSLCFITMCISSYCKSVFHAVVISALCYGAPVLVAMLISGLGKLMVFIYTAPVFMVIYRIIEDIYNVWPLMVGISATVSLVCVITAYRRYKRQQV